jgi:hypothetical protein
MEEEKKQERKKVELTVVNTKPHFVVLKREQRHNS